MMSFPFQVFNGLKQREGRLTEQLLNAERFKWSNRKGSLEDGFCAIATKEHIQDDIRDDNFEHFHSSNDCRDDDFQHPVERIRIGGFRERSTTESVSSGALFGRERRETQIHSDFVLQDPHRANRISFSRSDINKNKYASRSDSCERSSVHHSQSINDSSEMSRAMSELIIIKEGVPTEEQTFVSTNTSWSSRFSNQRVQFQSTSEATSSDCVERLYNRSKKLQKDGKKRREAIAQAIMQKQKCRTPKDYGTLPISKAADMYTRGIRALVEKEFRSEEKRRQKTKDGYINRRDIQLPSNSSQEMSGGKTSINGKLPLSKASDMYDRSRAIMFAKQRFLHKMKSEEIKSEEIKHIREKLPLSRAHDMYERAAKNNAAKEAKICLAKEAKTKRHKKLEDIGTRKKLPLSRACDMYHRSLRGEKAKNQKIEQRIALDKKKEEEFRRTLIRERKKRRRWKEIKEAITNNYDLRESASSCIFTVGEPSKSRRVHFADGIMTLITPSRYEKERDRFVEDPVLVLAQGCGVEVVTGARSMRIKKSTSGSDVPVNSRAFDEDTVTTADTSF